MEELETFELFVDETSEIGGVNAMSVVEYPAMEKNFIALSKQKIQLAEINGEKRILMGAAMIPDKKIYRRDGDYEYNIIFSQDTVRKASELFLMKGNQNNSTLEHEVVINGMTVVESWIVEDPLMDKANKYNMSVPKGTWMISMKVNNDAVWNEYVKTGYVKGFSLEGIFTNNETIKPQLRTQEYEEEQAALAKLKEALDALIG